MTEWLEGYLSRANISILMVTHDRYFLDRVCTMVNVPVLVLILAIVFAFWITIPLLVVGLFCECRYHFAGIDNINVDLNSACDKVADTVETIKTDINKN